MDYACIVRLRKNIQHAADTNRHRLRGIEHTLLNVLNIQMNCAVFGQLVD